LLNLALTTSNEQQHPIHNNQKMMKQPQQPLLMIAVLASLLMSCSMMMVSANATTNIDKTTQLEEEKRSHLRALIFRGAEGGRRDRESSQGGEQRKLDPSLSDFAASLDLYQMDTSYGQPFEYIVPNGATGQLFYSPSGWDFTFAFVGRNLPSGTAYQLVLRYNLQTTCLGSPATVGQVGGLFIRGTVPLEMTMWQDDGAKVLLAPAADVDCAVGSITSSDNYVKYLFLKPDYNLEFDYLGDGM
jgi:hypothetical protein